METVQDWIDELMKVEDKTLPIFGFDCRSGVLEREISIGSEVSEVHNDDSDIDLPTGTKYICVNLG